MIAKYAVRWPEHVWILILTGPTMDPAIRNFWQPAFRLELDGLREPALVGPAVYDFRKTGPCRVYGTYLAALADRIEDQAAASAGARAPPPRRTRPAGERSLAEADGRAVAAR